MNAWAGSDSRKPSYTRAVHAFPENVVPKINENVAVWALPDPNVSGAGVPWDEPPAEAPV